MKLWTFRIKQYSSKAFPKNLIHGGIVMKFMKKLLSTALSLILVLFVLAPDAVYAETSVNVTIDGQRVNFPDRGPAVIDGRTLVPVRGVFEALGFDVSWNQNTQQATLTGNTVVVLTIGSSTFTAGGTSHSLDVPARIIDGRTMLPIRAVLESTGFQVDWVEATRTVRIMTSDGTTIENTDDWISVQNIRIPRTWILEDIGLRGAYEVFNVDRTISMQVEWLRERDYEYLMASGTAQEFLFDDGNIGVMLVSEGRAYWINQNMYILSWNEVNSSVFVENEDLIFKIARTLTST